MRTWHAAVGLLSIASLANGQASYPMLMSVSPVAVQVGNTAECEIHARYNLNGTYQVMVTGNGVTGEVDPPKVDPKDKKPSVAKLKVRFKASADALPGVREVRLITPLGASTVAQLVVVQDPVIRESPSNDTMKTAQAVKLPATLCGAFEKVEDVDYFKFNVNAGHAFTFHVRCQRLQDRIHDLQDHADPILTLKNSAGTVLAMNDNFFFADPLLHYKFPTAGEYYLEIRDVRYGGNGDWQYAIEATDRPFVTNVHPTRVTPGVATKVELVGHNLPADPSATISVPADATDGLRWVELKLPSGQNSNIVPVVVSRLPDVREVAGDNDSPAKAQKITIPAGISGRIETEGDIDCYSFEAKAGEQFAIQVIARDHQSMLDSIVRVLNEKGERLAESDDFSDRFVHADSRIEPWVAPVTGRFIIEIKDVHGRGGREFPYFLKVTRATPYFTLELDSDKTLLTPGLANVIYAKVRRWNGFTGEVQLGIDGLPPGVTASCGRILTTGRGDGCIVLRAAPDAKPGAANIRVTGTGYTGNLVPRKLTAIARPLQEVYMPGGGRAHYPVETHTVSVGEPLDLRAVKISTNDVVLKPGESKRIDVSFERASDFKQNVTLDVVYQHLEQFYADSLPVGVTIDGRASQTLVTGDQSKGYITLKAAADAKPVARQQVAVMAHVSINFVMKYTYAAEPLFVTVAKP